MMTHPMLCATLPAVCQPLGLGAPEAGGFVGWDGSGGWLLMSSSWLAVP
jgi:hypothetical protein